MIAFLISFIVVLYICLKLREYMKPQSTQRNNILWQKRVSAKRYY